MNPLIRLGRWLTDVLFPEPEPLDARERALFDAAWDDDDLDCLWTFNLARRLNKEQREPLMEAIERHLHEKAAGEEQV